MIVVTTPTGQIGSHIVPLLLDAGEDVRVIARDPARLAAAVQGRVEVVEGSHGDAAVLDRALAGADALFWVVPPDPRADDMNAAYVDFSRPAAQAIQRHGIGHVVAVTTLGRGTAWRDRAGLATNSLDMDDLLAATGAAQRGLACPGFMDNMLRQIDGIKAGRPIAWPVDGAKPVPQVAVRDIAAVAVGLLTDRSWRGQGDVSLLGPAAISFDEMVATMSEVLGREVRYQQVPWEAFGAQMRGYGSSAAFVDGFLAMMRAKDELMDNVAARADAAETPTSFRQWCEEVLKPAMGPVVSRVGA